MQERIVFVWGSTVTKMDDIQKTEKLNYHTIRVYLSKQNLCRENDIAQY